MLYNISKIIIRLRVYLFFYFCFLCSARSPPKESLPLSLKNFSTYTLLILTPLYLYDWTTLCWLGWNIILVLRELYFLLILKIEASLPPSHCSHPLSQSPQKKIYTRIFTSSRVGIYWHLYILHTFSWCFCFCFSQSLLCSSSLCLHLLCLLFLFDSFVMTGCTS